VRDRPEVAQVMEVQPSHARYLRNRTIPFNL
jgi:hypothetical protein